MVGKNDSSWKLLIQQNEYFKDIYVSCSVMFTSLWPHGLLLTRLLCPWNSPGKNTGVSSYSLLQGIFPAQGSNLGLLALQADSNVAKLTSRKLSNFRSLWRCMRMPSIRSTSSPDLSITLKSLSHWSENKEEYFNTLFGYFSSSLYVFHSFQSGYLSFYSVIEKSS